MAYKDLEFGLDLQPTTSNTFTFSAETSSIELPHSSFIRNAEILRDGMDLTLSSEDGHVVIENYFAQITPPTLASESGEILSPQLVNSFVKSGGEYASNLYASDESPVGLINEMSGDATVTRTNGSSEPITLGTEIYQGDVVETATDGAVNIVFTDESSFAVSEDARLAIDEYVFDPATEGGTQDFSVLKGVFVYTSGLIGRDDPDDVNIDTPVGSIGIRGTIIAGDVDQGEITVVEGAIVLRDFGGNEVTLANQFETAKFDIDGAGIKHMGELSAGDVAGKFSSVSGVAPTLFSSINDAAAEQNNRGDNTEGANEETAQDGAEEAKTQENKPEGEQAQEADTEASAEQKTEAETTSQETTEEGTDTTESGEQTTAEEIPNIPESDNTTESTTETVVTMQEKPKILQESTKQTTQEQTKIITMSETLDDYIDNSIDNNDTLTKNDQNLNDYETTRQEYIKQDGIKETTLDTSIIALKKSIPKGFGFIDEHGVFEFKFENVFKDAGNPDADLTFQLHPETRQALDAASDLLDASGWNFDSTTGKITLNLETFTGNMPDLNITLRASADGGNTWGEAETFSFNAYNEEAGNFINFNFVDTTGTGVGDTFFIDYSGGQLLGNELKTTIFVKDGNNGTKEIVELNGLENATVFSGQDDKSILIQANSENNSIIAGNNEDAHDEVIVKNANNTIHTMGGNDTVKIYLDDINSQLNDGIIDASKNENLGPKHVIDGGSGNEDTLILFNNNTGDNESINLATIDTEFKNFEILALDGGGVSLQSLTVEDIFSITDSHNELRITSDSSADIDIDFGEWNAPINNGDGSTTYSATHGGQEVTLIVESSVSVI